jgi:hypothetical protein
MDRGVGVVRVVDPFGLVPYFKDKNPYINKLYLSKIFQNLTIKFVLFDALTGGVSLSKQKKMFV